jgi:hypothetical protein
MYKYIALLLAITGFVGPSLVITQAATPAQNVPATETAIPAGFASDRCEPNDSLVQPCAIPSEVETSGLTFVDDGIDVYSVLLKANRTYSIQAISDTGIDPVLTLFRAGATEEPIAQNDDLAPGSGNAGIQQATTTDNWYLIQVENAAPGDMYGRTYTLSVRSSAATIGVTNAIATPTTTGDTFENNWRLEDAPRLAWDVPYDLSLICPETRPGACSSGDHDFFRVPIKSGVAFAALTYDLGPGADTTIAVYRPDPGNTDSSTGLIGWQLAYGNDDAVRGRTLRSQILFTPDWDGEAVLIVAASDRADPPRVPEAIGPSGRYRLILGSPFLPGVQQVLAAQQETSSVIPSTREAENNSASPTATLALGPTILPTPPASGDAEEIIREECVSGSAIITNPAGARFSAAAMPETDARILMIYPPDTEVVLLGSCYLGWVKVRPTMAVSPGWMFAPDLQLLEVTGNVGLIDTTPAVPTATMDPLFPDEVGLLPDNQNPIRPLQVERLPARAIATPTALPRQAVSLNVEVQDNQQRPRIAMRVQLVDVLGRVLREGQTDAQGRITLVVDLPATSAVWLQIPTAGITTMVDKAQPAMLIQVP